MMGIDWFTFAAQIINFVVLVYLLNYFLYEPITTTMQRREQSIADRLKEAERREADASVEIKKYESQSEILANQSKVLLEQASIDSENARQKMIEEARLDVEHRRHDWLESLQREQATLVSLIRQRASQQVVEVSRNALSQLADTELEQRSLEQFIDQLNQIEDSEKERLKREADSGGQAHVHTAFGVSPEWQDRIEKALASELGLHSISFTTTPELICGIELHVGGMKIGWSVQEFLDSLTDELGGMLERH